MILPPPLRPGCTLAVVSPSWGGPFEFPHIYENGLRVIKELFGFRIKEYPTARMPDAELYANPRLRAEDINAAFLDPEVDGIVASIGGDDSIRLLPFLDLDGIRAHPKLLMGYSDTTTLLAYLNLHGLVTFYGPSVMAGFSYLENFPEAVAEYKRFFFEDSRLELSAFPAWTDQYQSWGETANTGLLQSLHTDDTGHRWLQKGDISSGRLWGGCVEVLEMMKATLAWPAANFWVGRILFLETSEDKPTPDEVAFFLRNYGMQGIFNKITGLLIGRPKGYTPEERLELDQAVLRVVAGEFEARHLNIVTNLDMGHTDPRHIFPLGVSAKLDPLPETVQLVDASFAGT